MAPGRAFLLVVGFVTASVLVAVVSPVARSTAVVGEPPAFFAAGQVRIFQNGDIRGGGTLVDRNWVLTAAHAFPRPDNPRIYAMRFDALTNQNDQNDQTNVRSIDRIVLGEGDVAMAHFADPVPQGTWIPSLATAPPVFADEGVLYGWGPDGTTLNRGVGVIYDSIASENAAHLRSMRPEFASAFPAGVQPMVTAVGAQVGDSGSGMFSPWGVLAGVHNGAWAYRHFNDSGQLFGDVAMMSYEEPVWQLRQWILNTINGVGSSGSTTKDEPNDELRRRRLTEIPDPDLPMTLPPQTGTCDDSARCTPTWKLATLTAPGTAAGLVPATCADAGANSCSLGGTLYDKAPGQVQVGAGREVVAWCKTTDALTVGGAPQQVLRVSFTNAERHEVPIGRGWWDVAPDQVTTAQGPVDPTPFAAC